VFSQTFLRVILDGVFNHTSDHTLVLRVPAGARGRAGALALHLEAATARVHSGVALSTTGAASSAFL
jgi:hypothetical protein